MRDTNFLTENNARHIWHPMAHPADMHANPPRVIMKGDGSHVTDIEGRRVLDAVGGLWNVNLGYSCDPIKQAIIDQLDVLPYYSGFRSTSTGPSIELAWELAQWFEPEGMTRTFFTSRGSDSVETALRLVRQYWKIRGQGDRVKFLALNKGYHGTHFGGASVNGNANFRRNYEPLLAGVFHIPAPYTYRNPFDEADRLKVDENAAARGVELAAVLDALQARHELVGDVRCKGLMAAIELVSDRASKKPADKDVLTIVSNAAYDAGVMLRISGANIILSPPLILTANDIRTIGEAIDAGLSAV